MPTQAFLAMIIPVGSGGNYPDNTLPGPQPPFPGGGGGGPVDPGYSPPWARPPVDPGYSPPWARPQPPRPTHPIYYPPGSLPHPDNTLPGPQPPFPQPPLGIWGPPDMPPGFWGGGMGPGVKPQPPFPGQPQPPTGPVDPGYSPPWAQVRPPVDPGYSPPWAQVPGGGQPPRPGGLPIQLPGQNPEGGGWVYAYVPGYGWMWIPVAETPIPPATTKPNPDEKPVQPVDPTDPNAPPA